MSESTDMFTLASRIKLPNGGSMPRIQLGLYMMSRTETRQAVRWALGAGYRGFDCAQMYHNEREAGQAIQDFLASDENRYGLTRADIHYTTKLNSNDTSYRAVRRSIKQSVDACGLGYIDLFLLHSPYGGKDARLTSWQALQDAVEDGEVRMAGVSNYGVHHIEELMNSRPRVHPVVNQIEVHPFNTQNDIRAACEKHHIVIEAYAPLVRGMRMRHPVVKSLSEKYACTPAQLLVRWSLQHGFVSLPKSSKRERLVDNVKVNNINIASDDMAALDSLDEHLVTDWDPTDTP